MIRIIFWIIFALCVCISIIDAPRWSGSKGIIRLVQSVAEGVIWGLALGGLFLIGTKIYHKLKSNWTSTKNRR